MRRETLVAAVLRATLACDPARRVRQTLAGERGLLGEREIVGIAIGKAALAMARGAGAVARGIAVAPFDDQRGLPPGWTLMIGAHPEVDARSVAAGEAVLALVAAAAPSDVVLALISGGASALAEVPTVPLATYRETIARAMAAGLPIAELNRTRRGLSRVKGGALAAASRAPVVTLVVSDVVGDALEVIGSGPTIGAGEARLIMPIASFANAVHAELPHARLLVAPMQGDLDAVADRLAAEPGPAIAWGEPTLVVPADHGEGGRAQHLALLLAARFAGTARAALVIGSDGCDGPPPLDRPWPAGAYVDGRTWAAIPDAEIALARRDAGRALASIDALVITGRTGINHADLVILSG